MNVGALLVLLASTASAAPPERLALIIGRNQGAASHAPLKYAEADADRVHRALLDVGQTKPTDAKLIAPAKKQDVLDGLRWAKERATAAHARKQKLQLTLYLSAHGHDDDGLELGDEVLDYKSLKAAFTDTGADVRVALIDACRSANALKVGGKPVEAFALDGDDQLTVNGEAWVTSSAEDEPSVEAGAWKGSVFTHHLVAALRGAADREGDQQVSLEELYRYAYDRTTAGQSGQHPGYAFRLGGHGALVLSSLKQVSSITIPPSFDAVTIIDVATRDSVLQARKPDGRLFGLSPGRYEVRALSGETALELPVTLAPKQQKRLLLDDFQRGAATAALLVRLSATRGVCFTGQLARPDPALQQLFDTLQWELAKGCTERSRPLTGTLSRRGKQVRLEGRLADQPLTVDAEADRLLERLLERLNENASP